MLKEKALSEEDRALVRKVYESAYRKANAEKIAAKDAARLRARMEAHPEKVRAQAAARQQKYRKAHPEKIEARKALEAAYKKANAEKQKARQAVWEKDNADKRKAQRAAWEKDNHEKVYARNAVWRKANREKLNALKAASYQADPEKFKARAAAWVKANTEKAKAYNSAYWKARPGKAAARDAVRRTRKAGGGGKYTPADIENLLHLQKEKCAGCKCKISKGGKQNGTVKYHVDHVVAVKNGGSSWPENLQLLCGPCNSSKHSKDDLAWANEHGLLFV